MNTLKALQLTQNISKEIKDQTFHHHYYILYDILNQYNKDKIINYVEIGTYGGGSACLAIQRPNTNVISIDLGHPIPKEIPIENVNKLNKFKNNYTYIQGNSQMQSTKDELLKIISEIDVLFIDGDHSHQGVINDFMLYETLVKPGGYIVFDDYNDYKYSPQVKIAVDNMISTSYFSNYKIIGTFSNIHNARPDWLKEGNDFIIQKND